MKNTFSLIAIKNGDNKFLLKYNKEWDCYLLPYFDETSIYKILEALKNELDINENFLISKILIKKIRKFSYRSKKYKNYKHIIFFIKKDNLKITDSNYKWFSINDLENDINSVRKNSDIIDILKNN